MLGEQRSLLQGHAEVFAFSLSLCAEAQEHGEGERAKPEDEAHNAVQVGRYCPAASYPGWLLGMVPALLPPGNPC